MPIDLYIRETDGDLFVPNILDVEDLLGIYLMQLEMLLYTKKTEVLGNNDFGIDLEGLIYRFKLNEYEIKRTIENEIQNFCPLAKQFNTEINVVFMKGEIRDIAFVDIIIDGRSYFGLIVK